MGPKKADVLDPITHDDLIDLARYYNGNLYKFKEGSYCISNGNYTIYINIYDRTYLISMLNGPHKFIDIDDLIVKLDNTNLYVYN